MEEPRGRRLIEIFSDPRWAEKYGPSPELQTTEHQKENQMDPKPSKWGEAVLHEINNLPHLPYDRGKEEGATSQIDWGGQKILRKGPYTACVWAVYEVVLRAMKAMGLEEEVSAEDLLLWKEWTWIHANITQRGGIAAGLYELGWGDPIRPEEAEAGDLAQIWDRSASTGKYVFGHSVIILGQSEHEGRPTLDTWSAEPKRGHAKHWRDVHHPSPKRERRWWIARPVWSDGTPPEPWVDWFADYFED